MGNRASSSAKSAPRYPIESVDSALRLVKLIADGRATSVSAAARELEVAPSTAHRLLAMLDHHGLIEQGAGSRDYAIGPWLVDLALGTLRELDIRPVARPYLEALVAEVGETAHVTQLHGVESVFLDCVECGATVRATDRTGQRMPAHVSASGRAQLAQLKKERILQLYPDERLESVTDRSIHSREKLLRELGRIRKSGYAINRGETEPDVHAVAAAIVDSGGTPHGAITVAGPAGRMGQARMSEIADAVMATVADIGDAVRVASD